jgi:DNA-binding MarR family transcriptional regulator
MNYMARLSRVSPHLMTLTGFFHGVIQMAPLVPPAAAEVKPHLVRYHILKCLEQHGPGHPTEIAATLSVKKNTLSELLDRMVRDGLVLRDHDPGDRRRITLRVTSAGRSAVAAFEKNMMANIRQYLGTLNAEDRRDLVRAIESLIRILARHERRSAKPPSR